MFTEEQLKVILGMGDLGEQERELQRQLVEADALRSSGAALGSRRMDWASQANRALQGITGGMRNREAGERGKDLSRQRMEILRGLYGKPEKDPDDVSDWGNM
ncbi:MAG: hypothetical protein AMJ84_02400 [Acidithiobacillales bacterium SM23_46]|nr:MAG: hypothetical protein AMJ84_02400 [Acidithiobacillales bacterium SM23_46]